MLNQLAVARLRDQLDSLSAFVANKTADEWNRVPASGKWSARVNLAHLCRYHEVFLERLNRILREDRPQFGRYRAEDDELWPSWSPLPVDLLLARIRQLRRDVRSQLSSLSDEQLARTGIHPVLGEMDVPLWLEFFLLHEAHHLYAILFRLRES
ncbi:MAG: hypothetical protein DMG64_16470 [Acidobacteria bacterium]|nr:MAG: hypothetical protein DMG64_16470 [Acidobacteriota bacterium]PYY22698.1 MAG: hypothetical protein DMG62_11835 [Acidobacteriota bacterium]